MLRSAVLAVLAVALSSDIAAAQTVVPDASTLIVLCPQCQAPVEILLVLSLDVTEPVSPAAVEVYLALSPDLTEPTAPAPIEHRLLFSLGPAEPSLQVMESGEIAVSYDVAVVARQRRIALSLYATQGALQILDVVTTSKALGAGHREANPVFTSGNISGMVVVKAAVMGLHVFAIERLEKRNAKAAMWLRFATNAMMSIVVVNNLAVLAH